MTQSDSQCVKDFFDDLARDITPVQVRDAAHILHAPVSSDPEVTRRCALVLSDAELHRAERFIAPADRSIFIQRRAFRRFCGGRATGSLQSLSQISFEESENGRPYLPERPDLWFSFSSCRFGFLGAWSSESRVGVDIEDRTRNPGATEIARQFYCAAEVRAVENTGASEAVQSFIKFWSLKEAALKSIGEGLPFGLKAFEFELHPDLRVVRAPPGYGGPVNFRAHEIDGLKCSTAMVIQNFSPVGR